MGLCAAYPFVVRRVRATGAGRAGAAAGTGLAGGIAGDRRAGIADGRGDAGGSDDQVRRDGRAPGADLPDGADGSHGAVLRGADRKTDLAADWRVDRGV